MLQRKFFGPSSRITPAEVENPHLDIEMNFQKDKPSNRSVPLLRKQIHKSTLRGRQGPIGTMNGSGLPLAVNETIDLKKRKSKWKSHSMVQVQRLQQPNQE